VGESVADTGDDEAPPPLSPPRRGEEDLTDEPRQNTKIDRSKWDAVRADFESEELTEAGICSKYGVRRDELWRRARTNRWRTVHREGGLDRLILIRQLFGVLERHIRKLEETEMTEVGEKETTVLGKLVSTMDKLIEIEGRAGRGNGPEETREMEDIRNKLARRIDRLKQKA
jgi:hypothetical protein